MILFCANKILRHTGVLSAADISIGDRIDKDCYNIIFNDGSNVILPEGVKINLIDKKIIEINKERDDCVSGSRSKYKLKKVIPEFSEKNKDPYLIALCLCLPFKNGQIQSRKECLIDLNKIKNNYFHIELKPSCDNYYKISAEEGYPNLLKLELKKINNFTKLKDRFIPDEYLYSCFQDRVDLIRGCMDACGRFYKNETTFETSSKQLAKDFAFLVRSIGGFCKIRSKISKKEYFILSISFDTDFNPFLTKAKIFSPSKNPRIRSIAKIEKAGLLPCLETPLESVILQNLIEIS
jgi:hypothetical protein